MLRKRAIKVESSLDSPGDQHKDCDHRLNLIETTLKNTVDSIENMAGSIQKTETLMKSTAASVQTIQAWMSENTDSTVGSKDPKQGFLRATFNINKLPSENSSSKSKSIVVAGATWHLAVYKGKDEGKLVLNAFLFHMAGCSSISYDTDFTFRLLGSAENIEYKGNWCFNDDTHGYGAIDLVSWTRLTNFTNGFVDKKGNFEVQATISVTGKTNTNVLLDAEFLTSGFVKPDCILLVENCRFPVNKAFLSSLSSYFKTFFFGKNQEEVRLKDECAAEFLHLLKAIYLSVDLKAGSEDVIRNNVECLLRLARCYQVEIVTKRCEMYLEKCPISEVTLEDKVLYAQDYRLLELLEQCVKKFKTVDDVKKLRQSSQYSRLTKENQILIFENIT